MTLDEHDRVVVLVGELRRAERYAAMVVGKRVGGIEVRVDGILLFRGEDDLAVAEKVVAALSGLGAARIEDLRGRIRRLGVEVD